MEARICLNLQVISITGFHSVSDWCYQIMSLVSGSPKDLEDNAAIEKYSAEELFSAMESMMHTIRIEGRYIPQDTAHRMIQIASPGKIQRWTELKLVNSNPDIHILNLYTYLIDLKWTEEEQANLKPHVERYTPQVALEACRVY